MIEKIIHQIWIQGREKIPKEKKDLTDMWKKVATLSGYDYKLWSEKDYQFLLRENDIEKEYSSRTNLTQKSDIARWCILKKYGGFYIDVDIEPQQKTFPSFDTDVVLMRLPIGLLSFLTVGVSFIGVKKESSLSDRILDEMKNRIDVSKPAIGTWLEISSTTGSRLLQDTIKRYNDLDITWLDSPGIAYNYGSGYYLSNSRPEFFTVHQVLGKETCNSMCKAARVWSTIPPWYVILLLILLLLLLLRQ